MKIRAIETKYKGRYMRSRLEARWAVWFDAVGIKWEYEQVGMTVGDNERYLPDFFLPEWEWHVEIKPSNIIKSDAQRLERLKKAWHNEGMTLCVIQGEPAWGQYRLFMSGPHSEDESPVTFAPCRRCSGICFVWEDGWGECGTHFCRSEKWPDRDDESFLKHYETAMRYKFDHLSKEKK